MNRSEKLQKEYVEKHGLVGLLLPKSKKLRSRRYLLHRKLKEKGVLVNARKKTIPASSDTCCPFVIELINEFGYTLQFEIK